MGSRNPPFLKKAVQRIQIKIPWYSILRNFDLEMLVIEMQEKSCRAVCLLVLTTRGWWLLLGWVKDRSKQGAAAAGQEPGRHLAKILTSAQAGGWDMARTAASRAGVGQATLGVSSWPTTGSFVAQLSLPSFPDTEDLLSQSQPSSSCWGKQPPTVYSSRLCWSVSLLVSPSVHLFIQPSIHSSSIHPSIHPSHYPSSTYLFSHPLICATSHSFINSFIFHVSILTLIHY